MNVDQVKQALSGIPPRHPVAMAIHAVIAGMQLDEVDVCSGHPTRIDERTREHHGGRLAALRDLRHRLGELWAPSSEQAPPETVG